MSTFKVQKVYVVCGCYDYEGFEILGIYKNKEDAEVRKSKFKQVTRGGDNFTYTNYVEADSCFSYDDIIIEEEQLL